MIVKRSLYWIDMGWACGGMWVDHQTNRVVDSCPIYRKFIGKTFSAIYGIKKMICLGPI